MNTAQGNARFEHSDRRAKASEPNLTSTLSRKLRNLLVARCTAGSQLHSIAAVETRRTLAAARTRVVEGRQPGRGFQPPSWAC